MVKHHRVIHVGVIGKAFWFQMLVQIDFNAFHHLVLVVRVAMDVSVIAIEGVFR